MPPVVGKQAWQTDRTFTESNRAFLQALNRTTDGFSRFFFCLQVVCKLDSSDRKRLIELALIAVVMPSTTTYSFRLTPDEVAKFQQMLKSVTGNPNLDIENLRLFLEKCLQKPIIDNSQPQETVAAVAIETRREGIEEVPDCDFRAYDRKKQEWYCDVRKVNFYACVNRQTRFLIGGFKCYPAHYGKNYKPDKSHLRIFDKGFRCAFHSRLVNKDELPLAECDRCPNGECKREIAGII